MVKTIPFYSFLFIKKRESTILLKPFELWMSMLSIIVSKESHKNKVVSITNRLFPLQGLT